MTIKQLRALFHYTDDYPEVLKDFRTNKELEEVLNGLRQHHKYMASVYVLEELGRFQEAVDILQALGPSGYYERFDMDGKGRIQFCIGHQLYSSYIEDQEPAYKRKLAQLKAHASLAKPKPPVPTITLEELDSRLAYGEIPKDEYEIEKAKLMPPSAKPCANCGQPVEPAHKFCPHCGAKN